MNTTPHPIRNLSLLSAVIIASVFVAARISAQSIGQWDFNANNLTATAGSTLGDLTYADGVGGATDLGDAFGSTTALGIPDINGTAATVLRFPAATGGMGYSMPTPGANGGGTFVNEYTIIFDLLYPSNGVIRPLLDTDQGVFFAGADFVVDAAGGIGATPTGPFDGTLAPNTWNRVGFTVTGSQIRKYINGVAVGSLAHTVDGRFAMFANNLALLLGNVVGDAGLGYVNSIQLRDAALSAGQMQAMGGPSAAGIPLVVPAIPSFVQSWTPPGAGSRTVTDLGAVINPGDASVNTGSIVLKLNTVAQTGVQISSNAVTGLITVLKPNAGPLTAGNTYTLEVSYTDSQVGAKAFSKQFKAALIFEDFELLPLGANVQEGLPTVYTNVWTKTPPAGWSIDDSGVPGVGDPDNDGVTEWAGWSFASKTFWGVVTDNQNRQLFTLASGTVAVADNDEWDDAAHPRTNYYTTYLTTSAINITGIAANSIFMKFDSSWRPEGNDDWPELGQTNNQTALITVSYDGGPPVEVMRWSSLAGPNFHDDNENEKVSLLLNNPAGKTNLVVKFGCLDSANDWWWAFDNLEINIGDIASSVVQQIPTPGTLNAGPRPQLGATIIPGTTSINPVTILILLDGASVPVTVTTNVQGQLIVRGVAGSVLPDVSTHTNRLVYTDSLNGQQTNTWSFTVDYDQITLGTPVWFENFDGVAEASFPAGWTATNQTTVLNAAFDLNDPESAAYHDFVVVSTNRLGTAFNTRRFNVRPATLNGEPVDTLMGGNLVYGESDNRGGEQVQVLYSPLINLTGITGVYLGFRSIYEQNQDSLGAVEYSIDGGATWLPALYMVAQADVIAGDPVATLGTPRGDQAHDLAYGAFIGGIPDATFEPFISGRVDDDPTESKRIEKIFLPMADNQANVRLRFTHTGTGSWYFGFDDVGFYGTGATNVPVQIVNQPPSRALVVGQSSVFTVGINPYSTRPLSYQWQKNSTNIAGGTSQTYTLVNAQLADSGNYRVVVGNVSGSVTSDVAVVTVQNPAPNIITQPASVLVSSGFPASFNVVAQGTPPLSYQWYRDTTPVGGNSDTFSLASATATDAGQYRVVITNAFGAVTSAPAALTVVSDPITGGLVVHLKFDNNYSDSSSRGNNATNVGAPAFNAAGKIGQAFQYTSFANGTSFNYATLNYPPDLHFTASTDFSVSYWSLIAPGSKAGDPPAIANKNWDSGSNIGFVLGVQGNNNFEWNYREECPNTRKDFDSSVNMVDGQWHHVVFSVQRGGVARTFIDGVLRNTQAIVNAGNAPTTIDTDPAIADNQNCAGNGTRTASAINIGQDGRGNYTDGGGVGITNALIDDVGIWRRAVTPEEAVAIYNAGNAGQHLQQAVAGGIGTLQFGRVGGNIQFSWTAGATVRLQKTASLNPASWSDVPGTLGASSYSEATTGDSAYYRLFRP